MNIEQMNIAELPAPILANQMLNAVPFTHLGLFEGIGGFSLAARWMGWETLAWCEWNEFGQKVLKHHFPKAEGFGDITKTDFTKYANTIDILTGGFPCQPYSVAGKRLGKEDERHLWPEMLRAIREVQPTYVVGENVSGLISWDGGLVFHEVQTDLENEGYEIFPVVLPACAINAPHRRDRVWFIAYSHKCANMRRPCKNEGESKEERLSERHTVRELAQPSSVRITENPDSIRWTGNKRQEEPNKREQRKFSTGNNERIQTNNGEIGLYTNTNSKGLEVGEQSGREGLQAEITTGMDNGTANTCIDGIATNTECSRRGKIHSNMETWKPNGNIINTVNEQNTWANFPTQPPLCGGDDGLPKELDGITFPKWRAESIKAYGNAIVPQVALQIFKALESVHGHSI